MTLKVGGFSIHKRYELSILSLDLQDDLIEHHEVDSPLHGVPIHPARPEHAIRSTETRNERRVGKRPADADVRVLAKAHVEPVEQFEAVVHGFHVGHDPD